MAAIQHACVADDGTAPAAAAANTVAGRIGQMTPEDWATLAALWRQGWPTARLAGHFGLAEAVVIRRLRPLMKARAAGSAAFDGEVIGEAGMIGGGVSGRPIAGVALKPEFVKAPEAEAREVRERDEAHWRAALAAGGFAAAVVVPGRGVIHVYPEGAGAGRRAARRRRTGAA